MRKTKKPKINLNVDILQEVSEETVENENLENENISITKLDIKKPIQREISSSSLSELSSPIKVNVKDFEDIVPKVTGIKLTIPDYIKMLEDIKIEYNRVKDIAKSATTYYENWQREVIHNECNTQSYMNEKQRLNSKFESLSRQFTEFKSHFEDNNSMSEESYYSEEEEESDTSSKHSATFSDSDGY